MRAFLRYLNRLLFGDDIFISYSRLDGYEYALRLSTLLTRYNCFVDQLETTPGAEVPQRVLDRLKNASVLVLVGTPGAAQSEAVLQEVDLFLKSGRTMIPITVNGALEQSTWFDSHVKGLPLAIENSTQDIPNEPTEHVLIRIEDSFKYARKRKVLRTMLVSTLLFVGFSITGVSWWSAERVQSANDDVAAANTKVLNAEKQVELADTLAASAQRAADASNKLAREAERRSTKADSLTAIVEAQLASSNILLERNQAQLLVTDKQRQFEQGKLASVLAKQIGREEEALRIGLEAVKSRFDITPVAEAIKGLSDAVASFMAYRVVPIDSIELIQYDAKCNCLAILDAKRRVYHFDLYSYSVLSSTSLDQLLISHLGSVQAGEPFDFTDYTWARLKKAPRGYRDRSFVSSDGQFWASLEPITQSLKAVVRNTSDNQIIGEFDHPGVEKVVFASDGRMILTIGSDTIPKLWLMGNREEPLAELVGHSEPINHAIFVSGDQAIATASDDGTAKVWLASGGTLYQTLDGHSKEDHFRKIQPLSQGNLGQSLSNRPGGNFLLVRKRGVNQISYSSKNELFATAGKDKTVIIWRSRGYDPQPLQVHEDWVNTMAFSDDGGLLVSGGQDGKCYLWDGLNGRPLDVYEGNGDAIVNVSFIDNRRVLIESEKGSLIWTFFGDLALSTINHETDVASARYFSNDQKIVSTDWLGGVKVWDVNSGQTLTVANSVENEPSLLDQLINDANANNSYHGNQLNNEPDPWQRLHLDEIGNPVQPTETQRPGLVELMGVEVSEKTGYALAPTSDGTVIVWNLNDLSKPVVRFDQHYEPVAKGEILLDGKTAITQDSRDGYIWNIETGQTEEKISFLKDFDISSDGRFLAYMSRYSGVVLKNLRTNLSHALSIPSGVQVSFVKYRGVEHLLILNDHSINVYSMDGELRFSIKADQVFPGNSQGYFTELIVSNNGNTCLVIDNYSLKSTVISLEDQMVIAQLPEHFSNIEAAKFTPDGKYVITATWNRWVRLFDAQSGELLFQNRSHTGRIWELNLSKSGNHFVTVANDGVAKSFRTPTLPSLISIAEQALAEIK